MSFKDVLKKLGGSNNVRKQLLKQAQDEDRVMTTLEERKKSANQRELESYIKEEREKNIKKQLIITRKQRDDEMNFGHNPLGAENVIAKKGWEVLKEKNLFTNENNMFSNQEFIHKNNPNLLNNNQSLYGI